MNTTIKKQIIVLFIITFFLALGKSAIAKDNFTHKTIPPRNTVEKNVSANQFVKKLLWIIKIKDLKALMNYIDPQISLNFGGSSGLDDFKKYWGLKKEPKKSELWHELEVVLRLGGVMQGKEMVFPYLFVDWPDGFESYKYEAIIGNRVNFRKKPSIRSKIIRQLNYEVVFSLDNQSPNDKRIWRKIKTYDNKVGYVHKKYIRSAIDYRLFIEKTNKGWKINTMIAGD